MNAITPIILPERAGLLTPSAAYKPFRYPWAFDMWKKQQQVHWMPEEVPLGEDVKDWAANLTDSERNLLTQIFRFFTQADIEVQDNYMEKYGRVFKPTEVKMMLASFANMETIHIAAYALLLSLALGLCGSAAARDQEPSRARKSPQAASKAAPKVKPQPAPAPRALPRQSASAEARLLEIYRLIGSAQADVALGKAESLVRDVPNFQLAQLVYGDLLLARTHALPTMGNAPAALAGRAQERLTQLRVEANRRLTALGGQMLDHFAEGGILATDDFDVVLTQVLELDNEIGQGGCSWFCSEEVPPWIARSRQLQRILPHDPVNC